MGRMFERVACWDVASGVSSHNINTMFLLCAMTDGVKGDHDTDGHAALNEPPVDKSKIN